MKGDKEHKQAAAIRFQPDKDKAPIIVAMGQGYVAEKIIEKAEESNIPTYVDPHLAKTLASMQIGEEIPPELYEVVAQILVFVSNLDKKYGRK